MKKLPCTGKEASPTGVRLKAEVADSDEAMGKDVKKESADEVWARESQRSLLVVTLVVAVAKGHLAAFVCKDAFVPDGDAMGVATEVVKDLGRACHGGLGIDDPFLGGRLSKQTMSEVGPDTSWPLLQ